MNLMLMKAPFETNALACITISSDDVINTYIFNELLKNPEKLVNHLCLKFPDHRETIIEKFKPFLAKRQQLSS